MGLGIKADKYLGENVPGTCLLDDLHGSRKVDVTNSHLKRSKDGIVLVPQPSDSPNDPLNWPFWRKAMLMATLTYGAGVVGAFGPIIGAGFVQVAQNLGTSVDALSKVTSDIVLTLGLILILTAPASVVWGRRPVYLAGNILLLASCIWSAVSPDIGNLKGSRIIGGAGMAPVECLVEATIADVFFVHERGKWIAVWSFALLGGVNGVSIVNGYLIQDVSWRVCFVIEAALVGLLLVMTILFVPETAYNRPDISTIDASGHDPTVPHSDKESDSEIKHEPTKAIELVEKAPSVDEIPSTYWQRLKPWAGYRFSHENFFKIALRPFTLVLSPAVAWGTLMYGTIFAWIVSLSVSISLLFSTPQFGYNFKAGPVGLISGVGPFIATFIANAIAGPLSDWSAMWLSRRNRGIYEPEFRLSMVIPLFISSTIGWFGWAISANMRELWIGPAIFYTLIGFGESMGAFAVVAYVVDAHPNYAPEAFATINCIKNLFAFAVTYFVAPWLTNQGVLKTFCTIGGINMFVCFITIPMYIYGKRARSWVHRTPWMLA